MQKKLYVWEVPVRVTHWLTVICLIILSFTGIYIYSPFIASASEDKFIMGWMRFLHLVAAYIFVINWAVRLYWSFAGNKFYNWRAFFPYSSEKIAKFFKQLAFYALIGKKPPSEAGHTVLAGFTYFLIFMLCVVSAVTGFALYSLSNPGGIMSSMFRWVFLIFSIPATRLLHHIIMWLFLYFAIIHVYIAFFLNSVEKNNLLTSIFDGYKTVETEKAE